MGYKPLNPNIPKLMNQVTGGTLGLPEFQRDFKWEAKATVSLIASIIEGYPIGSLLTWVPGNTEFGRRSVHMAPPLEKSAAVSLILDGQQRITSIFLALIQQNEKEWALGPKRKSKEPTYWLHLKNFMQNPDEPETFITYSRPIIRREKYVASRVVDPVTRKMMNFEEVNALDSGYVQLSEIFSSNAQQLNFEKYGFSNDLNKALIKLRDKLNQYEIPTIEIDQNTGIDSVAFIFEKVNNSGLVLDTFELLNAKLYKHSTEKQAGFHLRDLWKDTLEAKPILSKFGVSPISLIQAISLNRGFTTRLKEQDEKKTDGLTGVSCKKKDLFQITGEDVRNQWPAIVDAIEAVLERLSEGHILGRRWFPYPAAIIPMALAYMQAPKIKANLMGEKVWMPLLHSYWNTIFLNRYSSSSESLMASDLIALHAWIHGGKVPDFMSTGENVELNLYGLEKANSVIYQGIIILLINSGSCAKDWFTDGEINHDLVNDKGVDDHHIFPRKSFQKDDIGVEFVESILNRTLITPTTNQVISNKKPTKYLADIFPGEKKKRSSVLTAHFVPEYESKIWENFPEFLKWRQEQIKPLILEATGWKNIKLLSPNEIEENEKDED